MLWLEYDKFTQLLKSGGHFLTKKSVNLKPYFTPYFTHKKNKTKPKNIKTKQNKTNLKNITHFTTNNLTKQTEMWYIIHTTRKSTNKSN